MIFTYANKRLFIRPLEIAAHTNMTIITNLRTYQFDIRSGEYDGKADEEEMKLLKKMATRFQISSAHLKGIILEVNELASE